MRLSVGFRILTSTGEILFEVAPLQASYDDVAQHAQANLIQNTPQENMPQVYEYPYRLIPSNALIIQEARHVC